MGGEGSEREAFFTFDALMPGGDAGAVVTKQKHVDHLGGNQARMAQRGVLSSGIIVCKPGDAAIGSLFRAIVGVAAENGILV